MKLYDTINGTFISDAHVDVNLLKHEIASGEYSELELDSFTLEGDFEDESITLRDFWQRVGGDRS